MPTSSLDFILQATRQTRQNMIDVMAEFQLDQLNKIPEGFRNNLAWNFGHAIVTQQLLCYGLSGLPVNIDKEVVSIYRKGGVPAGDVDQASIDAFIAQSTGLLDTFVADYQAGIFKEYKTYTTSFGTTMKSVEEAFQFNLAHEAMHLGTMLAIRKLL